MPIPDTHPQRTRQWTQQYLAGGLIALAGLFLAKFAKVGLVAVLGLGAAARRLFRRTPRA